MSRTVPVGLGERAYDVVVGEGLLDAAGRLIAPFQSRGRTAVVSDETVWALFPSDTTYFGSSDNQLMVNYRVRDLDAMLAQLRAAGVAVDERVEEIENGRFGWATDPEGNRIELWEPR